MPLVSLLLLATGSLLLLPGPAVWLATGDTWAFSFSAVGVAFLFLGWAKLGFDIAEVRREPSAYPNLRRHLMWLAYGVSWLALVIGMITLRGPISMPPPPPIAREILRGLFPYVPSIYGPVVLGQVAILLLGTDFVFHRRVLASLVGTSALLAISITAIILQLQGALGPGTLFLAGSTGLGYLLVAMAWLVDLPLRTPAPDQRIGIAEPAHAGHALAKRARWWRWGRRRNGWAALIPGIVLSIAAYLLTQFRQCEAARECMRPFLNLGLGVLGFGAFLIVLGLVFFATS